MSVQYGACCLTRDYSLSSWLHQTILGFKTEDLKLISAMVSLLSVLWRSLSLPTEGKQDPEIHRSVPYIENPGSKVLPLLLKLLPKLSAQLGDDTMTQFISVFCDLMISLKSKDILSFTRHDLVTLIDVYSTYFFNKREFYDLLELGCEFVNNSLLKSESSFSVNGIREKLRTITILWVLANKNSSSSK